MKRYFLFCLTMLLLPIGTFAQYARITYPIDRTIFQQSFDGTGTTHVAFAFQIDMLKFIQDTNSSGGILVYQIEEVDLKTGEIVLSTPQNWTNFAQSYQWDWHTGSIFETAGFAINDVSLPVGWYKLTLGVYLSDPNVNLISPLSSIKFGVGDNYFVAGQSNASGYDDAVEDNVQNYSQTYPTTEQFDAVSYIKCPLEANGLVNYDNTNILGLPFNPRPNPNVTFLPSNAILSNLTNGNNFDANKIYPNGRGSWYWAQFAHRMVKPVAEGGRATPVMIYNVATPDKSMEDWAANFNTTRYIQLRRMLQTYGSILGVKAVLWFQGENDTNGLRQSTNQTSYVSTYSSRLNNMIGWSRGDLIGGSNPNNLKKLSWYVAKDSYACAATNWVSTNPNDPLLSSLLCNAGRVDITQKMTSDLLKAAQQNDPSNNIFAGTTTSDDINECNRASIQRKHFTGEGTNLSLQTMGNWWFDAIKANYNQSSVEGKYLLRIDVTKDASNNYVLHGPRKYPNQPYAKYFWVKNGNGVFNANTVISTDSVLATNTNFTDFPEFYICYVSEDTDANSFRLQASQPFVMKNAKDQNNKLRITNGTQEISQVSFDDTIDQKGIVVESDNIIWDSADIPFWATLSTTNGSFQNTLVNITTQANNTNTPRQAIIRVKQFGTLNSYEQPLILYQASATCEDVNNSSITPTNPATEWTGFGSLQFNKSVGGNIMKIGGQTFINGLGTHANSTIKFNIGGQYEVFQAYIGRDDEADGCMLCGTGQTVVFKVKADGNLLYTSPNMGISTPAQLINIPITGKNELELIVEDGGDNFFGDHANWADAKLLCNAPPCANYLTLVSPADDYNGSEIKRAIISIDATNKINNGANVEYKVGNSILLKAGFKVEDGAVFKANITTGPCN